MGIPNREEMQDKLISLGIKTRFKVDWVEDIPVAIKIQTRKPPVFISGYMKGTEIVGWPRGNNNGPFVFDVWTSRCRLAKAIAQEHKLRLSELDGETILDVPADRADAILPKFGAKVKQNRKANPKAIEALKAYRQAKKENA